MQGYLWGEAGPKPPREPVLGDQASILGLPDEPGSSNAESGTFNGFTEKLPLLPEQPSTPQPHVRLHVCSGWDGRVLHY